MSIPISIGGTVVNFPSSAQDANWAPALIQFAQLVAASLSATVGPFDVAPQVMTIDSFNPGTNVDIPLLSFPNSNVRSAKIRYAVYRTTSTTTVYESGDIEVVYNAANPTGFKWELGQSRLNSANITFNITDSGQVQFSTTTLSGINHTGSLSYASVALTQS